MSTITVTVNVNHPMNPDLHTDVSKDVVLPRASVAKYLREIENGVIAAEGWTSAGNIEGLCEAADLQEGDAVYLECDYTTEQAILAESANA